MKDIIKITLLCHSFPPVMGGGETIIYLLAKYVAKNPLFKVTVITGNNRKNLVLPHDMEGNFKVVTIPDFEEYAIGKMGLRTFLPIAFKALSESSPDIIHAFNFFPGYIGSVYAKYNKIPLVFTYFNTPRKTDGHIQLLLGIDVETDQALISHLYRSINPELLITLSEYYKDCAIKMGVSEKNIRWCYPGPDRELFNPSVRNIALREKLGVSSSDFLVVVPSRIIPRKRIEVVIEAFKDLKGLPVKLVISSGGVIQPGYEDYYQKVIDLIKENFLLNSVILPTFGFDLSELGELYASADICVLSSAFEGLGVGILDAMQSGIPVVASNTAGINEIITDGNNGLLFSEGNSKELAGKIKLLLTDQKLKQNIVKLAIHTLNKKFNLSTYVSFHENIYKDLIFRRSSIFKRYFDLKSLPREFLKVFGYLKE